jgi:hypothetical protein
MPALGRQRKVDLCEFEGSLVYKVSWRRARATQRNPVLKKKKCSGPTWETVSKINIDKYKKQTNVCMCVEFQGDKSLSRQGVNGSEGQGWQQEQKDEALIS